MKKARVEQGGMVIRIYRLGMEANDLLTQTLPLRGPDGKKEVKVETMARLTEYALKNPPLPLEADTDKDALQLKFRYVDFLKLQELASKMNMPLITLVLVAAQRMADEQKKAR